MKGLIRKGDEFKAENGAHYIVTSFSIATQVVKYVVTPSLGAQPVQEEMSAADWRTLVAGVKTPDLAVPAEGFKFQMMDNSVWEITAADDENVTIRNGDTEQSIPLTDYNTLLEGRYIKAIAE